jgi:carboxyl-terminal processing protease
LSVKVFVRFRAPSMASLSKEHLSLGLNVSLNDRNEIIIIELDPNGPAFQTE